MAFNIKSLGRNLFEFSRVTGGGRGITLEVDSRNAQRAITVVATGLRDRRLPNRQISVQLYSWVIRNFDRGGRMQTPPWAPLKESTLKQKERLGYSSKPLLRTGNLRQSFVGFYDAETAGVRGGASVGVDYAVVHETGIEGRLEARPMLPPFDYARRVAMDIYGRHVATVRRQAGL